MRLRFSIGLPLVLLFVSSGAMADPSVTGVRTAPHTHKATHKAKMRSTHAHVVGRAAIVRHERKKAAVAKEHAVAPPLTTGPGGVRLAEGDHIAYVRCVGPRQLGRAAWYGGKYIGRATSSGAALDTTHATAAHRSLPLNSLARVTNLDNGRSIVVRVTDRGPVSPSLLIDMSPRAAEELDMKRAGIVPVAVEQVVEVPSEAK